MATTAVLRAIVVDKVQSSRVGGSAVSCSISANDNGSASASSSQTIKQEDGLERRASQASETSTQQKDDEEILNAVGILAPGPDRFNEHKGYRIVSFFRTTWHKLTDVAGHVSATSLGIREHKKKKSNLEDDRVIEEKIEDFPNGFPRLAYLQSSNKSFAIYRVFRYLCARVLIHKETEIDDLEKQLAEQDSADEKSNLSERKNRLRSVKYSTGSQAAHPGRAQDSSHPELIQVISEKLKEYAKFKNLVNQVASFEEAPTRDHESVLNWILKEKPLCNGSYDFIWHKGDFASLKGSPVQGGGSGKAGFFENIILALAPYGLFNKFIQPDTDRGSVNNYSNFRFELLRRTLVIITAAGSILIPVFMLFLLDIDSVVAAFIVFISVVLFSIMVSVVADPSEDKLFIAVISYSAVLSAFLAAMNQATNLGSKT